MGHFYLCGFQHSLQCLPAIRAGATQRKPIALGPGASIEPVLLLLSASTPAVRRGERWPGDPKHNPYLRGA